MLQKMLQFIYLYNGCSKIPWYGTL